MAFPPEMISVLEAQLKCEMTGLPESSRPSLDLNPAKLNKLRARFHSNESALSEASLSNYLEVLSAINQEQDRVSRMAEDWCSQYLESLKLGPFTGEPTVLTCESVTRIPLSSTVASAMVLPYQMANPVCAPNNAVAPPKASPLQTFTYTREKRKSMDEPMLSATMPFSTPSVLTNIATAPNATLDAVKLLQLRTSMQSINTVPQLLSVTSASPVNSSLPPNAVAIAVPQNAEQELARKKRRGNLPKSATNLLKKWLYDHLLHPYPTEEEKSALAAQTGLSLNQICNWFINARRRILQPMLENVRQQTLQGLEQHLLVDKSSQQQITTAAH